MGARAAGCFCRLTLSTAHHADQNVWGSELDTDIQLWVPGPGGAGRLLSREAFQGSVTLNCLLAAGDVSASNPLLPSACESKRSNKCLLK